jgi:hypothetical protein
MCKVCFPNQRSAEMLDGSYYQDIFPLNFANETRSPAKGRINEPLREKKALTS